MKHVVLGIITLLLVCTVHAVQAQTEVINGAKTALKSGSSKELAKYFNSNIELIIESENVDFDKVSDTQAELILRSFFQKNPAKDFTYGHQGASPDGLQYSTGTYASNSGEFLVYMVIKQFDGRYLIDRIDFRK